MRGKRSARTEQDVDHGNQGTSRDGNSCVTKPETVIEPEVKRRKSRKPSKLEQETAEGKSQVSNSAPGEGKVGSKKGRSASGSGGEMKVHGYHHDFELEMDLNDPLQNLVRIIQPSLNLDLSKAGIYLCGVQELNANTCLKNCVRDGSVGMVKVKLSVQVLPDKRPSINVEDVLQATGESRAANNRESPSTSNLSAERLAVGKRSSNVKKRIPRSSKRVINDQNTEWVPSESFATLRESVDIPQDPLTWSSRDIANWMSWVTKHFDLPDLNVPSFSALNGATLCALSRDTFSELVGHDERDLFWTHLELLRSTYQAAVPVPAIVPCLRASAGTKTHKLSAGSSIPRLFAKESTTGSIQLWQFLLELLSSSEHSDLLEWHGDEGEFRLLNPEKVAELWGRVKSKAGMNYEKMSRALRYYYDGNILAKVQGKHFTYKFVCDIKKAVGYTFEELKDLVQNAALRHRMSPGGSSPSSPPTPASGRCESDISIELPLPSQRKTAIGALDMRYLPPASMSQIAA